MRCPKCGRGNCYIVNDVETKEKGYGICKGICGYWIFGAVGLLCGLCGMGKTKTITQSYWICPDCGRKFKA